MMRIEDAEAILGRKIKTQEPKHKDWKGYVGIFALELEGIASRILRRNPVLVVHPGHGYCIKNKEFLRSYGDYESYVKNLRRKLKQADDAGKIILVFVSKDNKKETLDTIGNLNNAILIPTENDESNIASDILGISSPEFYKKLSKCVKKGRICGEWVGGCLTTVEKYMKGTELNRVEGCLFPTGKKYSPSVLIEIDEKELEEFKKELKRNQEQLYQRYLGKVDIDGNSKLAETLRYFTDRIVLEEDFAVPVLAQERLGLDHKTFESHLEALKRNGLIRISSIEQIPQSESPFSLYERVHIMKMHLKDHDYELENVILFSK